MFYSLLFFSLTACQSFNIIVYLLVAFFELLYAVINLNLFLDNLSVCLYFLKLIQLSCNLFKNDSWSPEL